MNCETQTHRTFSQRNGKLGFLIALLLTSCYKIVSVNAPKEVAPGETFEVSFTIVDDGSATQNFVTDWSYAGIRLPDGWTATVPAKAHRQFAEEWVYYPDGSKVNSSHDMEPSDKLTQFYNGACPRTGYSWAGFKSVTKIPKNITACWRNGTDSIRITFLVTVPDNAKPGTYSLDFIGGDEEDDAGLDKYNTYTDAKGSRIFHVGTVASSYIDNKATHLSHSVIVSDVDAIHAVNTDKDNVGNAYDLNGRPATKHTTFIIQNGKKRLKP